MSEYRGISVENFLDASEVELILDFAKFNDSWDRLEPESFWDNRLLSAEKIYKNYDASVGKLMLEIKGRVAEKIKESYGLPEIYADTTHLVRWFPGQEQGLHDDDMKDLEGGEEFHHREFGSIIYLNNDYSGGRTYYSQHSIEVSPEPGLLAVHPGDSEHMHGVTKIEGGIRYTIASFWTSDKRFYDK